MTATKMVSSETNINAPETIKANEPRARDAAWTAADSRYWTLALIVLCIGIGLRQLWLADFPYHPDEAIHAWFPLNFAAYNFDPIYHGPLLYHLQALVYSVLWPDDYTARLMPSLMGIGLLAMIIGPTRRWLGDRAALWSLVLVCISPVILTYQRRLLHDSLVLVLTLGAVLCFQAALENASDTLAGRKARIGLVVLLSLFVCTKANAFFIIAMLIAFWAMTKIKPWLRARWNAERIRAERESFARWVLPFVCFALAALCVSVILQLKSVQPDGLAAWLAPLPLLVLGVGWLVLRDELREAGVFDSHFWKWLPAVMLFIVSVASVLALRDPPEWKAIIEPAYMKVCVLCVAVVWLWLLAAPRGDEAREQSTPARETPPPTSNLQPAKRDLRTPALAGWAALLAFAFLFGHGYLWYQAPLRIVQQPREWAASTSASARSIATAAWQPIDRVLHLDFGEVKDASKRVITDNLMPDGAKPGPGILVNSPDWNDIGSALPKMVAYWGKQQKEPRLPGRHDYYIVLMLLYELPIVLAGLGGIVHACRRRTPFTDLLLWWVFTSFTLYALANEKVPWLLVHIMLPWALLAGVWLAQVRYEGAKKTAFIAASVLGAIYLVRGAIATNFQRAADHHEPMFYAQTSETFRDALFQTLRQTQQSKELIWMHNELQWPTVWYTRDGAPWRGDSPVTFTPDPGPGPLRMAISKKDVWDKTARFKGWAGKETNFYIWPRASWPALRPLTWARFWWTREATPENGVLAPPGEWPPPALAIVAAPPCGDKPCP